MIPPQLSVARSQSEAGFRQPRNDITQWNRCALATPCRCNDHKEICGFFPIQR